MEKMSGKGNFANMPQEVKMTQYPKYPNPGDKELDDTITGIDQTVTTSSGKRKKYVSNQK
jgi:hypothetical protein